MTTAVNSLAMPVPGGFTMFEGSQEIVFERKWFSIAHLGTLVFAVVWNAFTYFFYIMMMSGNVSVIILLFPIMHLLVGLWLMYYSLCGFFNKTIIKANHQEVSVRHLPLPWGGEKVIHTSTISQLYIVEQTRKHRGSIIASYDIQVLLSNAHTISLVKGLDTREEALFLERTLERFLHIEDQPVEGAYIFK